MTSSKSDNLPLVAAQGQPSDFIRKIVARDLETGKYAQVHTRFPPEPNGYLHIGHAKAILLNFGIAREMQGICNLRYDDTNPTKEKQEYVDSIFEDVMWLIGDWSENYLRLKTPVASPQTTVPEDERDFALSASTLDEWPPHRLHNSSTEGSRLEPFHTSDHFEAIYHYAMQLIRKGSAYVCDLSPQAMASYRGAPDRPGRDSPFRSRSVSENLELFGRMKNGEFAEGKCTLRAKIDMASPNFWLRDPILYRIRHAEHHRTGRKWCIYPMYDFAQCLSDYIEGVTHSMGTLEFEVHRPLYVWILRDLDLPNRLPRRLEFARFSLTYTVMSKRKLLQLVAEGRVKGWDDPRMPTISGYRRRGVSANVLRNFMYGLGITKYKSATQIHALEHAIRAELNHVAVRRFVVLRPLPIVITNYPKDKTEEFDALNNPEDLSSGIRKITFSRNLYIEREDFAEAPSANYFRFYPGGEVRLKNAYIIRCNEIIKDDGGNIVQLRCTADLESKAGAAHAARKMRVALHWVNMEGAVEAEVRLYDQLFTIPNPEAAADFRTAINPNSLQVLTAKCEPSLTQSEPKQPYQFERLGYFVLDRDSAVGKLVFNRTIELRTRWLPPRRLSASDRVSGRRGDVPVAEIPAGFIKKVAKPAASKQLQDGSIGLSDILSINGRILRTASLLNEYNQDVGNPQVLIDAIRSWGRRIDLLTFIQRPEAKEPKYDTWWEPEEIAALPLTSFDEWWNCQIGKDTRRKVLRAEKAGVVVKHVPLNDYLIEGVTRIFNETRFKRGKPHRHYGKKFAQVKAILERDCERCEFIAALFEGELIGFVKLLYTDRLTRPVLNLAMFAHRDKMTNFALMAEVARSTAREGIPFVTYGIWKSRRQGMREFLISNGFGPLKIPRFYVPLNIIGRMALSIGIQGGLVRNIPDPLMTQLLAVRSRWYANR